MIILVLVPAILILSERQDDCIRMVLFFWREIAIRMVVNIGRMITYIQDDSIFGKDDCYVRFTIISIILDFLVSQNVCFAFLAGALESYFDISMVKPIILRFLVHLRMVEFYHPRHQDGHPSC